MHLQLILSNLSLRHNIRFMKAFLFIAALSTIVWQASAQDIKGKIQTPENEPYLTAEVTLLQATDSSDFKYGFVQEDGTFVFNAIPNGDYILKVSEATNIKYVALPQHTSEKNIEIPTIVFEPTINTMEQVVYRYQRPLVEMKPDGLVFNVDSTINAIGQNGLELMRKSPGVVVDKDENITMNGKNGVRVYIDGKLSPLTGTELSEFLKTIQSSNIDVIEIISSPSAKYDAVGNAGVINIKLKKNKMVGTNGTVNLGYAIQRFGKYNGGVTLNHRQDKFNIYGSYNINNSKNWSDANFQRRLLDTFYDMKSVFIRNGTTHNYKGGIDVFVDEKNTIGVMVTGNVRDNITDNSNNQVFINTITNEANRTLVSNNKDISDRNNYNLNLNYQYNDKKKNRTLTLDGDYGRFSIFNDQYQPNIYSNNAGIQTNANIYNLLTDALIDILTLKADYEQPFLKGKLGVGAKLTNTGTKNDFGYLVQNNASLEWNKDLDRSNTFDYQENIQAIYGMYKMQVKQGLAFQAGLRVENTITNGISEGERWNGTGYDKYTTENPRNYLNFFPNLSVTLNKNPMSMWNFVYSKRIDRPNYQDINPFEYKMTDYSYRKGNIQLKPQLTNAVSVTHTFKYMLNTRLEYSHTSDVFAELVDTINGDKLFQTKQNLATNNMISLNISMPFAYKKFSSFLNINTYYTMFKADYGEGREINLDAFTASLYGQIGYKINEWLSAEISGWWSSPSIWQGTFRSIAMGGIDAGIQARVLKGKGNVKAAYGDIFGTMKWGGSSNFAGQYVKAFGHWESQQFRINFTYNFGNNKIKSTQRKLGSEEEAKRAADSQSLQQGR